MLSSMLLYTFRVFLISWKIYHSSRFRVFVFTENVSLFFLYEWTKHSKGHMVATHSAFDFDKLTFAAKLETNKRGGKYAQVGYDGSQVFFQLGDSPREALRCPFGLDTPCAEEKDKRVLKLELTPATRAFLNTFDKAVVTAAERNSMEWFKKSTPSSNHVSSIKTQNGGLHYSAAKLARLVREATGEPHDLEGGALVSRNSCISKKRRRELDARCLAQALTEPGSSQAHAEILD